MFLLFGQVLLDVKAVLCLATVLDELGLLNAISLLIFIVDEISVSIVFD